MGWGCVGWGAASVGSAGVVGSVVGSSSFVGDGVGLGVGVTFRATVSVIVDPWLTEDPAGADCRSTVPASASSVSRISTS